MWECSMKKSALCNFYHSLLELALSYLLIIWQKLNHHEFKVIIRLWWKQEEGKDIWLVGGGQLNSLFLKYHLIDEIIISVLPVVLGTGLTLFGDMEMEVGFDLKGVKSFESGLVQMTYIKR